VDKRIGLIARTKIDSRDVWFATTHLSATINNTTDIIRHYQCLNLVHHFNRLVPDKNTPIILGGDMNTPGDAPELSPLHNALTWQTQSVGPTWPLDDTKPQQKMINPLDHIFTRAVKAGQPEKFALEKLSDHAVVVIDLKL
jgi:endonuclease/exonuclease/phosphatase family metal-dependent hydrolase